MKGEELVIGEHELGLWTGTELERAQAGTIRSKPLKIAGSWPASGYILRRCSGRLP